MAAEFTVDELVARAIIGPDQSIVVVVPVFNAYEELVRCLEAIERHTRLDVPVLIVDDRGSDRRTIAFVEKIAAQSGRKYVVLENSTNLGFVRGCNRAFRATGDADVIILNSDVVVGAGWVEGLEKAAASSNLIATVSTLTNFGTILSTPNRNVPTRDLPGALSPESAARVVAQNGLGLNPTIPTAVGHCMLIRRIALRLLGGFDETFGMGYGEEVDFSLRAVQHGLRNICADNVFTYHKGHGSFGLEARQIQAQNERVINSRYRWYLPWVESEMIDLHSPLADAIVVSARALRGLHLGIDARSLGPHLTGTQRVTLETIRALAAVEGVSRLSVYLPGEVPVYARDYVGDSDSIEFVTPKEFGRSEKRCDVIYRPFQVNHPDELDWLRAHGYRVIVNQLDVISYNNPDYAYAHANWNAYRELTKLTMAMVDGVAFISNQAREEVHSAGLLDGVPTAVVWCGADSGFDPVHESMPLAFPNDGKSLLLCVGHSFHHKNRVWAIKLFKEVTARGWDGRLVLAGPNPPDGNSLAAEADLLFGLPEIADRVTAMGSLSEPEKQWLMNRTALMLYPTMVEGFGLVPFEAAEQGIPTLSTRQGSLDEVLPTDIPTIDDLDLGSAADAAYEILTDPDRAKAVVEAIQRRAQEFTWAGVAERIVELADETLRHRSRAVVGINTERLVQWFDELPLPAIEDEARPLRYWLEHLVQSRPPGGDRIMRKILPVGSKRQTAFRQFVNYLRVRFS